MFYPFPWHTSNFGEKLKARDPETMNPWRVYFENELPKPTNGMKICEGGHCNFHMDRAEWGSANARVKEVTLDEAMYDDKMNANGERPWWTKYSPWSAPGHAYIPCNDGCGVNGLNPCGCNKDACENSEDTCPKGTYTRDYFFLPVY